MHPLDLHPHDAVARQAWEAIKQPAQPIFDELPVDYRSRLLDAAGHALSGDPMLLFERKVAELSVVPEEVREELVAEVVEEVQAESEADAPPDEPLEPEEVKALELKGPLPKDFPAHEKLHEAGINTYGQLAKTEDLTVIRDIGPVTVKEIRKRLRADVKALNK